MDVASLVPDRAVDPETMWTQPEPRVSSEALAMDVDVVDGGTQSLARARELVSSGVTPTSTQQHGLSLRDARVRILEKIFVYDDLGETDCFTSHSIQSILNGLFAFSLAPNALPRLWLSNDGGSVVSNGTKYRVHARMRVPGSTGSTDRLRRSGVTFTSLAPEQRHVDDLLEELKQLPHSLLSRNVCEILRVGADEHLVVASQIREEFTAFFRQLTEHVVPYQVAIEQPRGTVAPRPTQADGAQGGVARTRTEIGRMRARTEFETHFERLKLSGQATDDVKEPCFALWTMADPERSKHFASVFARKLQDSNWATVQPSTDESARVASVGAAPVAASQRRNSLGDGARARRDSLGGDEALPFTSVLNTRAVPIMRRSSLGDGERARRDSLGGDENADASVIDSGRLTLRRDSIAAMVSAVDSLTDDEDSEEEFRTREDVRNVLEMLSPRNASARAKSLASVRHKRNRRAAN